MMESLNPPKKFSPQNRENLGIIFGQKCPCTVANGLCPHYSSSLFFFFPPRRCLFFFFFFSFDLLGRLRPVLIFFFFFLIFFLFLFRCDFFSGHDFYFLINLGDWFFFFLWLFITFLVLIEHHFLIRVYA